MPVAALVDQRVFCVHSGISPSFNSFDQLNTIQRPTGVDDSGLLTDMLWANPAKNLSGWREGSRGASYDFGEDVLAQFMQRVGVQFVVRTQLADEGFELFGEEGLLLTIFSAANYCGQFGNGSAVLHLRREASAQTECDELPNLHQMTEIGRSNGLLYLVQVITASTNRGTN